MPLNEAPALSLAFFRSTTSALSLAQLTASMKVHVLVVSSPVDDFLVNLITGLGTNCKQLALVIVGSVLLMASQTACMISTRTLVASHTTGEMLILSLRDLRFLTNSALMSFACFESGSLTSMTEYF